MVRFSSWLPWQLSVSSVAEPERLRSTKWLLERLSFLRTGTPVILISASRLLFTDTSVSCGQFSTENWVRRAVLPSDRNHL